MSIRDTAEAWARALDDRLVRVEDVIAWVDAQVDVSRNTGI